MESKSEYLLRDGHFYRRDIAEIDLGLQDHILSQISEQQPIMLPRVLTFAEGFIHFLITKTQIAFCTELLQLPFTTWWMHDKKPDSLIPSWKEIQGSIKISDPWIVPPELGKMIFVVLFNRETESIRSCYLYLYRDSELYHFPYPNLFSDGRICMGTVWDTNPTPAKDKLGNFLHAYASFFQSVCSSHLLTANFQKFFIRNLSGWVYPSTDQLARHLVSNGPAFMQGFTL